MMQDAAACNPREFYSTDKQKNLLVRQKQQLLFSMWTAIIPLALALVGQVAGQTIYLAGDSTTAPGGGGKGTEGKTIALKSLAYLHDHPRTRLTYNVQQAGANTYTIR
jgi:uncharacterized protein YdeI (BOF family)